MGVIADEKVSGISLLLADSERSSPHKMCFVHSMLAIQMLSLLIDLKQETWLEGSEVLADLERSSSY